MATNIHFLSNVSEKTQSMLGDIYESVVCEISYTQNV